MLIILFGLPGAGKNFVGQVFHDDFGYYFYDTDDDLTDEFKDSIVQGVVVSDETRDMHYDLVIEKIRYLLRTYSELVVADAILKEKYRQKISTHFPDAIFVHVECRKSILLSRLEQRDHLVTVDYALKLLDLMEHPQLNYFVIENSSDGKEGIKRQIDKLLELVTVSE